MKGCSTVCSYCQESTDFMVKGYFKTYFLNFVLQREFRIIESLGNLGVQIVPFFYAECPGFAFA